ncbi:MAG: GPW/gp25 family protein [Actinomycetota bacterium]|nr:GPW/gp25 family protein [Actinomycetota bacterium]
MTTADRIGQGWTFPLGAGSRGGIALSSGVDKIEQAMRLILVTYPGERPMRAEFGSRLRDFVFESISEENIEKIKHEVRRALEMWEPRTEVAEVQAWPDPQRSGVLLIDITYQIRHTSDWRNLVFPFYMIPAERED